MIILDANILLYAFNADAAEHAAISTWLERNLAGKERIGLPWRSLLAFVRISTNPRVRAVPISMRDALQIVRELIDHPMTSILHPTEEHAAILERLVLQARAKTDLVTDASLAALAIEHGATLASTDSDFARFPGLKWINPLDAPAK